MQRTNYRTVSGAAGPTTILTTILRSKESGASVSRAKSAALLRESSSVRDPCESNCTQIMRNA